MPIYEYRCESCGHQQEFLQKVGDAPLTVCTQCGKPSFSKMVTAAGFQLKGSGWYATDFKNTGAKPAAKAAEPSKGDADHGARLYGQFCGTCHGGGVFLPNLPRSPAILSQAGFRAIVFDGAKKDQGMAPFSRFLNEGDVEDVRAYLLWKARTDSAAHVVASGHAQ